MGKYHKQESQYIYRQKGKLWHLLYSINIQTAKPSPSRGQNHQVTLPSGLPPLPTWPSLIKPPLMHSHHSY